MDGSLALLLVGSGGGAFLGSFFLTANANHALRLETPVVWPVLAARLGQTRAAKRMRTRNECQERRTSALYDMPVFLDILTLGLSAGLSFDAALELYCSRYSNPLSDALSEAMLSWRIGLMDREEALNTFADTAEVSAARRFSSTVTEALAFGSPLAEALERQAEVIRDERRSELEEEMERLPVKMLIPLGTLIVPAMLLAILGPLLAPALGRV